MNKGFWATRTILYAIVLTALFSVSCYFFYFFSSVFDIYWAMVSYAMICYMCGKLYSDVIWQKTQNTRLSLTVLTLLSVLGALVAGVTSYLLMVADYTAKYSYMWYSLLSYLVYAVAFLAIAYLSFSGCRPNIQGVWPVKTAIISFAIFAYQFIFTTVIIIGGKERGGYSTFIYILDRWFNTMALLGCLLYITRAIIPESSESTMSTSNTNA